MQVWTRSSIPANGPHPTEQTTVPVAAIIQPSQQISPLHAEFPQEQEEQIYDRLDVFSKKEKHLNSSVSIFLGPKQHYSCAVFGTEREAGLCTGQF
mmetsp:Transcript_24698/g.44699  ORF Transcript_24698/g.44699 Transcript_24698/m.44699 type:complete len:96 (+) Transcript_24698:833-1120(+)